MLQDVKAAVKGVQPAGTLAGRTANSIHWSPQGRNLVLAGLKVGPRCILSLLSSWTQLHAYRGIACRRSMRSSYHVWLSALLSALLCLTSSWSLALRVSESVNAFLSARHSFVLLCCGPDTAPG